MQQDCADIRCEGWAKGVVSVVSAKCGDSTHLADMCRVLLDESTNRTGDLYIRSICFSPDGKYLATGAEDRQIRVSLVADAHACFLLQSSSGLFGVASMLTRRRRSGTSNKNAFAISFKATCRKSTRSTFLAMVVSSFLDQATNPLEYGTSKRVNVCLI